MEVKCVCKLEKKTRVLMYVYGNRSADPSTLLTNPLQVDKGVAMYNIRLPPAEKSFAFR